MLRKLSVILATILIFAVVIPAFANGNDPPGAVYAMTNAADGNEVVMYDRAADGTLTLVDAFATGGQGLTTEPDDALGSENPLILSPEIHLKPTLWAPRLY